MLESYPILFLTGALLGGLGGLGVGGGSLLMLWLTVVLQVEYPQARTINLLFFLPCALISCFFRKKQGDLPLKKILPAIIAGAAAAGICAFIGKNLDTSVLQKGFGILLLITGVRELCYRPRKAR